MPDLLCANGHDYHFRNTRGTKVAGRPCPECGEPLRGKTAYRCNRLGYYTTRYWPGAHRGRCSQPKAHGGPHSAFGNVLYDTPEAVS